VRAQRSNALPDRSVVPSSNDEEGLQSDFRTAQKFQFMWKTVDEPRLQMQHRSSMTSHGIRIDPASAFCRIPEALQRQANPLPARILRMIVETKRSAGHRRKTSVRSYETNMP
jgi:hypothetical protein